MFLPSGLWLFKVHVFATSDNGINVLGFCSTNSYASSRARLKLHPFSYWQFKVYFRYWEVTHGDAPLQKMLQLQLLLTAIGSSTVLAKHDYVSTSTYIPHSFTTAGKCWHHGKAINLESCTHLLHF